MIEISLLYYIVAKKLYIISDTNTKTERFFLSCLYVSSSVTLSVIMVV